MKNHSGKQVRYQGEVYNMVVVSNLAKEILGYHWSKEYKYPPRHPFQYLKTPWGEFKKYNRSDGSRYVQFWPEDVSKGIFGPGVEIVGKFFGEKADEEANKKIKEIIENFKRDRKK